jgi:hypothetical protein
VAKTLTIKDAAGKEQTFSFTDSTDVAGAAGSQGLSNQQGNQVIVRYLEQDPHTAVRIEIVPKEAGCLKMGRRHSLVPARWRLNSVAKRRPLLLGNL